MSFLAPVEPLHENESSRVIKHMQAAALALRRGREGEPMKPSKQERLEAAGWRVGTAEEFLGLSEEEAAFVEIKLALADGVRRRRRARRLTWTQLTKKLGSSQSRVAKIGAADPPVSIDLLVRSLLAMGASLAEVTRIIGRKGRRAA